jgi:two-component system chemotaxis response regulator CheB
MMSQPTRVLIVDDSPFVCRLIAGYLRSAPGFEVIGAVHDGQSAIEAVKSKRPDAVTLDLEMPQMDGLAALARIMRECPTPVVVISGASGRDATRTLQALDLGAADFVLKYAPGVRIDPEQLRLEIVAKVWAAARVPLKIAAESRRPTTVTTASMGRGVVVIGASTGGPPALREILGALPQDFDAAVVVVQHMPKSFTGVLAAQLHRTGPLPVREAEDGDLLRAGSVLVAPGGYHLLVKSGPRVSLIAENVEDAGRGHCPSIDITMQSAARVLGTQVTGVVLSGMGDDGTEGLRAIHRAGGPTFAQSSDSCVIGGMPTRAMEAGVVGHIANPEQIAALLTEQFGPKESVHA